MAVGRLVDRVAIVTGAGRGIGRAVSLALAAEGAKVIVAEVDATSAATTIDTLRAFGAAAHQVVVDVTKSAQVVDLVEQTIDRFGRLDILINNAGVGFVSPLAEHGENDWDRVLDVNLKGTFLCTREAAKVMIARGSGKIVNFTSTSGFVASTVPSVAYDASKAAIRQLTVSAAAELAPHGINVNAVAPGTILTDLTKQMLDTEQKVNRALAKIPIGRLGTPDDIVGPVLFLCSSESDYVTGHVLVVDGGWLLH